MPQPDHTFEEHRPRLQAVAYRMLGSAAEAEDAVQETWLRWRGSADSVDNAGAWLTRVLTRICLDQLESARRKRTTYVGPWLPEPRIEPEPIDTASLSLAFLCLLETLSPAERAVFLLRQVFDYSYAEIGEIVGRSEASCRQLHRRAKAHVDAGRPRFEVDPAQHEALLVRFLTACQHGDLEGLKGMLAEDVESIADGGGIAVAGRVPIVGAERVGRMFITLTKNAPPSLEVRLTAINGRHCALVLVDGALDSFIDIDVVDGRIATIRNVRNPNKLAPIAQQLGLPVARAGQGT